MSDWVAWTLAGSGAIGCALLGHALLRSRQTARHRAAALQHAERELRKQTAEVERLRASLSGVGEGILVLDEDQHIVACNVAARELACLPADPTPHGMVTAVLPWGQLHDALAQLQQGGHDESKLEFELTERSGEEERVLAVRVRRLPGLGFVIGIDDQSRLRRLESLRRDFVANVSHELKTPLAAIKGFVETMADDRNMPEATRQRFLERVARQTERLNRLVGDLLTLSRLDEVEDGLEGSPSVEFRAIVTETLRDLAPLAEQRGIHLAPRLPVAVSVRGEREGLRQVVGNLVDNAIKYSSPGGRVEVVLQTIGDQARLSVIDTGIGLSVEDQKRIFERFYRVDRARSRELGGTGLGLSIVKNTVRGLGGEVGVDSELGRGSTFWVTLPTG